MRSKFTSVTCCLVLLLLSPGLAAERLFDAHMHYDAEDAAHYTPGQIIRLLDANNIGMAAVTSTPSQHARQLYRQAPERIVPILGVYRYADDKHKWPHDTSLPARIEAELAKGGWRGIGELHLFADNRHSPVFRRIIALAQQYALPLLLHVDPAVIDTLYEIAPKQRVIWAHAGTFPYPDLIADYLRRYPPLRVDLSVRNDRIAPHGELRDEWYELFTTHPERFMIGIDTYSLSRWRAYSKVAERIREWTSQLPEDVALRLIYENAAEAFDSQM
jgi:predicted TIM-barrel fold metal-dependent hydrolase